MSFKFAMNAEDLWEGQMHAVKIEARAIVLIRSCGSVFAYEDRCLHKNVPLSLGTLDNDVITCCTHHWQFHARSGRGVNPAGIALRSYPVWVEGGRILVEVSHDLENPDNKSRGTSTQQS